MKVKTCPEVCRLRPWAAEIKKHPEEPIQQGRESCFPPTLNIRTVLFTEPGRQSEDSCHAGETNYGNKNHKLNISMIFHFRSTSLETTPCGTGSNFLLSHSYSEHMRLCPVSTTTKPLSTTDMMKKCILAHFSDQIFLHFLRCCRVLSSLSTVFSASVIWFFTYIFFVYNSWVKLSVGHVCSCDPDLSTNAHKPSYQTKEWTKDSPGHGLVPHHHSPNLPAPVISPLSAIQYRHNTLPSVNISKCPWPTLKSICANLSPISFKISYSDL